MLRAYSHSETGMPDSDIIDEEIYKREKEIIHNYLCMNPSEKRVISCVACGGETVDFSVIDGTYYQRCIECFSVFASVETEIMEQYWNYPPLLDFRNSDEYQNSASLRRRGIWEELLFWLEYRFARYLGKSTGIDIIDISNRFTVLSDMIKNADFCASYNDVESADAVLYFDHFRCQCRPVEILSKLRSKLRDNGVLIMNMRVGSGFDILTLGARSGIIPYETILFPSVEGMDIMLKKTGFTMLEISTPGTLDIEHVLKNKEYLSGNDLFTRYLVEKSDNAALAEFQRFLQKHCMSSHARIIAKKA